MIITESETLTALSLPWIELSVKHPTGGAHPQVLAVAKGLVRRREFGQFFAEYFTLYGRSVRLSPLYRCELLIGEP